MKRTVFLLTVTLGALALIPPASAQEPVGTAFTYQGSLQKNGQPVDGSADFRFTLWDAAQGGNQIGPMVPKNTVDVVEGVFTVEELDFGVDPYTANEARWLEIDVRSPSGQGEFEKKERQRLRPTPFSLATRGIIVAADGRVAIGRTVSDGKLSVNDSDLIGVWGSSTNGVGVKGSSTKSMGVFGWHASQTGIEAGVLGHTMSVMANAAGVRGEVTSSAPGDLSAGVRGINNGKAANGIGVYGSQAGTGYGVYGTAGGIGVYGSSRLTGVYGLHTGETGTFPGVWGETNSRSTSATGVRGIILSTTPGTGSIGVLGINKGLNARGYGVKGMHDSGGTGVYGVSKGTGVLGESTTAFPGVIGKSKDGRGVWGESVSGPGVYGSSTNGLAGEFDGTVSVTVLEIAGADLAEKFPVSEEVKPGMVVAIDPGHPGKLCLARGVYNRRVAGVVSGANGLSVGAILGNMKGNEDAPPIALSGRVWVYCDAAQTPIEPGDLLTTSDTAGHAMKVTDHTRAPGAVLGKAMTALKDGKGFVLVLVSLQ